MSNFSSPKLSGWVAQFIINYQPSAVQLTRHLGMWVRLEVRGDKEIGEI